ncbi:MAG: CPBP family glutamic-type intramembrane protease [Rhodanobacteraceae bacterium]
MIAYRTQQSRLLSLLGLVIALGLPVLALIESHVWADLSARNAQSSLPLRHGWFWAGSSLRSEDHWRAWATPAKLEHVGFGLAGIAVNIAISVGMASMNSVFGLRESDSGFMFQLVQGHGVILVLLITGGALLTEIAFRGYAIERIAELASGRLWVGAVVQMVITTFLFIVSRGLAHGLVWLVDDDVFCLFYVWRRDTVVCLVAHAVPNFVASTLVALGAAI